MSTRALFFLIGFVVDFTSLAEFYLLRELGLDVASCYAASTLINLPWTFRPMFGYLSDRVKRRHAQLGMLFFFAFVMWMIAREAKDATILILVLFLAETAAAAGLTIADAYVVRLTTRDDAAMPKHHRYRIMGKILASYLSGYALNHFGSNRDTIYALFLVQGVVYLLASPFVASCLRESDEYETIVQHPFEHAREVMRIAWDNKPVRFMLACFTLFACLPDAGSSVSYYLVGPLRISPLTLATMDAVRGGFDLLGTWANPHACPRRATLAYLIVCNVLSLPMMALVCRCALIDDRALLLTSTAISAWISSAFSTVVTVSVAKISPAGMEGGAYNGIVSLPNVGQVFGIASTYALTKSYAINHDDFRRLSDFLAMVCALSCAATVCVFRAASFEDRTPP